MKRTLVSGGSGFTGKYVAGLLAKRGEEVHALVHSEPAEPIAGVSATHVADLADRVALTRVVQEVQPDRVLHLAAIAFVAHGDVDEMYRTNILGTRHLLDAITQSKQVPDSVVVASSANVYGNAREGILDESTPPAPVNDYGVTKLATEYVASIFSNRLPIIVTRPFNYTGVGQSGSFLIPKIIAHLRNRAPVIELGNLDVHRDFLDVRTVADVYLRLLDSPQAVGKTFNICSGEAVPLRTLLDQASEIAGHSLEVRVNPAFIRADEVRTLCGSVARLEAVIGPLRRISLGDTLRWMLES